MRGVVFDLKECAIHDGPGLRQTVFVKGCPLRCRWCHNPEGLHMQPQLMASANGCTHCGRCKATCPHPNECTACGACVSACPQRLRRIVGETLFARELADRLLPNVPYYASTGGGVTFSGGEPLMQPDFVLETVRLLDGAAHTALETSGYASAEVFAAFADAFDLILLDLKQMDDALHRAFTGVSNARIIANAERLCRGSTPFVVRIPVIPGVNDNAAHYRAVAELVCGAPSLERVELLPYHLTAGAKYAMLGEAYQPGFDTDRPIQTDQSVFEQYGIRSCVL